MTIYYFTQLTESLQLKALNEFGVLIAERKAAYCDIKLYQVNGFYVEVFHHTHFNVIVNINPFTNMDLLDPYFEQMNIDTLVFAS